ncbi:glycoside hydrolase [Rhizoclosmatium globosum]|uniref:Glycoside hydrolase n=1 Tax=Rhizoclosmatium globosum TaxID=329046 RepID=A0A1Y2BW94_9FUNG|nr:glycoside hydrolase [Rhizoclosmatium globosum]|eukprot:ORY39013.1 glycoside hydrolase [Rhizoclosmatium globosum]
MADLDDDSGLTLHAPKATRPLLANLLSTEQSDSEPSLFVSSSSGLGDQLSVSRAHDLTQTILFAPANASPFFADRHGRHVHLRGVNVCGQSKLPTAPISLSSHLQSKEFFNHKQVSFIGRPFPLQDADEHFARLKGWGLTFVRLLVTWEALEHSGPGIYDEQFIDYLICILKKADKYGIKCFIDPHQDTWSRFSGGSGAPGWTFEVAGMDITAFHAVGAAHVHNFNEDVKNPHMFWPTNYAKLACATMFTLFFAGHVLAPDLMYKGQNVGTFLQDKYIACYTHLARRLKDCKAVVGFEFMNEPHYGYIGLADINKFDSMLFFHFGPYPSALQSFALGSGMEIEVDMYIKSWPVPTRKSGTKIMNQERRSAWLNYGDCIWKRHGVWGLDSQNRPIILKPNYFTTNPKTGAPINYYNDFYMPMVRRYKAAIQSVRPDHLVFFEPIPNEDPPTLTDTDRNEQGYVYAPHWYDLKALLTKNFDGLVTFDVQGLARGTKNVLSAMYFGLAGAEVNYTGQMRNIVETGKRKVGQRPVLMGECGIPMDINEKQAFLTGDYQTHNNFLDTVITSMETNMLNFTLWNYNPGNDNTFGDHWNGEDFSIYSPNASVPASRAGSPSHSRASSPGLGGRVARAAQQAPSKLNIVTTAPSPKCATLSPSSPCDLASRRASHASLERIPTSPFEITGLAFTEGPLEGDPDHFHHVGGRALDAIIRPYASKIAGTPILSRFDLTSLVYTLEFTTVYNPREESIQEILDRSKGSSPDAYKRFLTEVFVPNFHYKFPDMQIVVKVSDGEWKYDQEKQSLVWFYDPQWKHVGDGGVVKHWLTVSTPLSYSEEAQVAASNRKGWSVWRVLWDFFEELCGKSR